MFATSAALEEPTWLEQLNPEQRAAATFGGGPLLIIAGAGTGKTMTLCARVAWLIEQGVPAERILLLTFTRRAARDMLARAKSLSARSGADARVVGGTFHSVAHLMVRSHAAALGLGSGFGVLDASDACDLVDLVREEQRLSSTAKRFPRKHTLLDIYSRTVNAQRPLSEVVGEWFPWCGEHLEALAELFRGYTQRKRELGVLDLDDLLLHWRALALDKAVGRSMGGRFDHVLVDEYQDVNAIQVDIVRGLRRENRDVTAVGDDFQAIYSFRSASADHILDFPSHFEGAERIMLERNYRSTGPILAASNAVSAQAERGYSKTLRTTTEGGERPELVFCLDEGRQASEVAERVLAAREEGLDLRRQAVLMRASHHSDLLELELTRRQIPFVKYGGLRYLEAAHVKDFVALLRLADNAGDEVSWFRVLQLIDGVGPAGARRFLAALDRSRGYATLLASIEPALEELRGAAREAARALIEALAAAESEKSAGARAERLRDVLAPLVCAHYPDGPLRLHDIDQLVGAAAQASELGHFVAELVIDPPSSSADFAQPPHLDDDYLVLSTVHSAKGLEWEAVHVIGAYDGNFPACMSAGSREGIEEERRLFYVALTRARRTLHVYVPVRYHHRPRGIDDAHGYGKQSRFLTPEVQALFAVTRADERTLDAPLDAPSGRIEVSLDALWT